MIAQPTTVKLWVQGLVEDEVGDGFVHIERLATEGLFELVSGDKILASEVGTIEDRYNIGLGESECIVIGKKYDCMIASDDNKARNAAAIELGEARVTGSLGLFRSSVISRLISHAEAFSSYRRMMKEAASCRAYFFHSELAIQRLTQVMSTAEQIPSPIVSAFQLLRLVRRPMRGRDQIQIRSDESRRHWCEHFAFAWMHHYANTLRLSIFRLAIWWWINRTSQ